MAIDPLLYEKVSGRSADPSRAYGEALASSAKSKQDRSAQKDIPLGSGLVVNHFKWQMWMSVIGALVVGGGVLFALAF